MLYGIWRLINSIKGEGSDDQTGIPTRIHDPLTFSNTTEISAPLSNIIISSLKKKT